MALLIGTLLRVGSIPKGPPNPMGRSLSLGLGACLERTSRVHWSGFRIQGLGLRGSSFRLSGLGSRFYGWNPRKAQAGITPATVDIWSHFRRFGRVGCRVQGFVGFREKSSPARNPQNPKP